VPGSLIGLAFIFLSAQSCRRNSCSPKASSRR
jgi:hypothetical protein